MYFAWRNWWGIVSITFEHTNSHTTYYKTDTNTGKTTKLQDTSEEVCVVDAKDEYRKKIKIVFANKKLKRTLLVLLF